MSVRPLIVLASGSPRRRQLLDLIGIAHRVEVPQVDEVQLPGESPRDYALRVARDKATAVACRLATSAPVLAADTVVEIDGIALGKPETAAEAAAMLRRLSGADHEVHTAVALAVDGSAAALVDTSRVRFLPLSDGQIQWYVDSGEPEGKAGAYAIQGRGGLLVAGIEGSPQTVIGLPIHRLAELFQACGLDLWTFLDGGP
jgi:septum formation protein